ncbi:hypothetical protein M2145_002666 [Lachnospiraceae bacterium PF1-21]
MKKEICFIDSDFNELFEIPDESYLQINRPDNETLIRLCRYHDEEHVWIGEEFRGFHEFASKMEEIGATFEPVANPQKVGAYILIDKTTVGNKIIALGHSSKEVQPYGTWLAHVTLPNDYGLGHYCSRKDKAYEDYAARIQDEKRFIENMGKPLKRNREDHER